MTRTAVAVLIGGWLLATALIAFVLLAPGARVADVLAVAAVAALAITLTRGSSDAGAVAALLAPLACISAGVLVYRGAALALRGGERIARRGPPLARLALVSLARAPVAPALAIAFIAVSTGLAGFRARVPRDAPARHRRSGRQPGPARCAGRGRPELSHAARARARRPLANARRRSRPPRPAHVRRLPERRRLGDGDGARRAGLGAEADRGMAPKRWLGANRDARRQAAPGGSRSALQAPR